MQSALARLLTILVSRPQNLLELESAADNIDADVSDKDFILSQDFFCTSDGQNILSRLECDKDNILCPKSPEKPKSLRIKRQRQGKIAKTLQFMHAKGIAHLDVKPDNMYVKDGFYKLGDFGCATLLDRTLPLDEGDACYMPQEILNDECGHLDKVDIFSLELLFMNLLEGSHLPESGCQFLNLREGKLPFLPTYSLQFQNSLKAMLDPDPVWWPSAKELTENPIFDRLQRITKTK